MIIDESADYFINFIDDQENVFFFSLFFDLLTATLQEMENQGFSSVPFKRRFLLNTYTFLLELLESSVHNLVQQHTTMLS